MSTHSDDDLGGRRSRSIREVLEQLAKEFPDVTVSKIRFLESRGLIYPQRTASGYRKFEDEDVERLRWILRQQRENFLPLKVIKGRLEQGAVGAVSPSLFDDEFSQDLDEPGEQESSAPRDPSADQSDPPAEDDPGPSDPDPVESDVTADEPGNAIEPEPAPPRRTTKRTRRVPADASAPGAKRFTAEELARKASTDPRLVAELDDFGMLPAEGKGEDRRYLESCVEIVKIASAFRAFGIEARHMRTFKHAAERDAGVFAQVISPMLQQRNPEARRRARGELAEIVELGAAAHHAFVLAALDALGRE